MDVGTKKDEIIKNIKQEPPAEFVCVLSAFECGKTLGGKLIIIKKEKLDQDIQTSKFQCKICRKFLLNEKNLKRHKNTHDKKICEICFRNVVRKNYEKHLKSHENEGERNFQCELCPKKFLKIRSLYKHRNTHKKTFECDFCGSLKKTKSYVKRHMLTHLKNGKYKCNHCEKLFGNKNQLTIHSMQLYDDPSICQRIAKITKADLTCRTCKKECKTKDHRKKHEKSHMERVECPICKQKYSQSSIQNHLKMHELKKKGKQIKCRFCDNKFLTKQICKDHEITHNKFECDLCGYKVASRSFFEDHLVTHRNSNAFECKICNKTYVSQATLSKHNRYHHQETEGFTCNLCSKTFKNSYYLSHHKKTHIKLQCQVCFREVSKNAYENHLKNHESDGKIKFQCDLCGALIKNKFDIKEHFFRHFQNGKYKCLQCRKLFDTQSQLRFHSTKLIQDPSVCHRLSKITKEDLTCKTCGKLFRSKRHRARHEKIHMEKVECSICNQKCTQSSFEFHLKWHELKKKEKQFKCRFCDKKFWTKLHCNRHEVIHNKFECDLCGYKNACRLNFRDHLVTHQDSNAFKCKICSKILGSRQSLSDHNRYHHQETDILTCNVCFKKYKNSTTLKKHQKLFHSYYSNKHEK